MSAALYTDYLHLYEDRWAYLSIPRSHNSTHGTYITAECILIFILPWKLHRHFRYKAPLFTFKIHSAFLVTAKSIFCHCRLQNCLQQKKKAIMCHWEWNIVVSIRDIYFRVTCFIETVLPTVNNKGKKWALRSWGSWWYFHWLSRKYIILSASCDIFTISEGGRPKWDLFLLSVLEGKDLE